MTGWALWVSWARAAAVTSAVSDTFRRTQSSIMSPPRPWVTELHRRREECRRAGCGRTFKFGHPILSQSLLVGEEVGHDVSPRKRIKGAGQLLHALVRV